MTNARSRVACLLLAGACTSAAPGEAVTPRALVRAGDRVTRVISARKPVRVVLRLQAQGACPVGVRVLAGGRTLARFRVWPGATTRYRVGRLAPGRYRVTLITRMVRRCRGRLRVMRVATRPLMPGPARPASPVPSPAAPAIGPTVPPSPASTSGAPTPGTEPAGAGVSEPTSTTGTTQPTERDNPLAVAPFYVDPDSSAARTEAEWRAQGRTDDADQMHELASGAHGAWFGDWNGADPAAAVSAYVQRAHAAGSLPLLVAYDIPSRDCGGFSAGGASSADAYQRWIDGFVAALQGPAVVVLEPDALAELDCLDPAGQQRALDLLSYATAALAGRPGVSTYLDAGNAGWHPAAVIAQRLLAAGVQRVRGFSLNVSNFDWTTTERMYGDQVAELVGGDSHFVIDGGRNGRGPAPDGSWCNPPGRGLGSPPTTDTGDPLNDAVLWIKVPGESDGTCNGGPAAGTWWPDYALALARNSAP